MITINMTPKFGFQYVQNANYNFNMTLLDNKYQLMTTPFQCKDYLNDIFFAEYTGHNINVYGLTWNRGMMPLGRKRYFLLALLGSGKNLRSIATNMQTFMNRVEDVRGIPHTKIMETTEDDKLVVKFSKEWTYSSWHVSSFATLLRMSAAYNPEESLLDYLKGIRKTASQSGSYLQKYPSKYPDFMRIDMARTANKAGNIYAVMTGKPLNRDWAYYLNKFNSLYTLSHGVHDGGVFDSSDFPTEHLPTEQVQN